MLTSFSGRPTTSELLHPYSSSAARLKLWTRKPSRSVTITASATSVRRPSAWWTKSTAGGVSNARKTGGRASCHATLAIPAFVRLGSTLVLVHLRVCGLQHRVDRRLGSAGGNTDGHAAQHLRGVDLKGLGHHRPQALGHDHRLLLTEARARKHELVTTEPEQADPGAARPCSSLLPPWTAGRHRRGAHIGR